MSLYLDIWSPICSWCYFLSFVMNNTRVVLSAILVTRCLFWTGYNTISTGSFSLSLRPRPHVYTSCRTYIGTHSHSPLHSLSTLTKSSSACPGQQGATVCRIHEVNLKSSPFFETSGFTLPFSRGRQAKTETIRYK